MTATDDAEAAKANHQHLVNQLLRFKTFAELRDSEFNQTHRSELAQLVGGPRIYHAAASTPRLTRFLRVVMWNIERGTHLDAISDILNHHPVIGHADLMLLNELDDGMVRSGNRNVAQELSRRL